MTTADKLSIQRSATEAGLDFTPEQLAFVFKAIDQQREYDRLLYSSYGPVIQDDRRANSAELLKQANEGIRQLFGSPSGLRKLE
jgi:hypothetical protein